DPARFKPFHGIARLKALEWANQFLSASREACRELTRIETMMGHIATTATGNANLREKARPLRQHDDLRVRRAPRAADRGKNAGSASADHDHAFCCHRICLDLQLKTVFVLSSGLSRAVILDERTRSEQSGTGETTSSAAALFRKISASFPRKI